MHYPIESNIISIFISFSISWFNPSKFTFIRVSIITSLFQILFIVRHRKFYIWQWIITPFLCELYILKRLSDHYQLPTSPVWCLAVYKHALSVWTSHLEMPKRSFVWQCINTLKGHETSNLSLVKCMDSHEWHECLQSDFLILSLKVHQMSNTSQRSGQHFVLNGVIYTDSSSFNTGVEIPCFPKFNFFPKFCTNYVSGCISHSFLLFCEIISSTFYSFSSFSLRDIANIYLAVNNHALSLCALTLWNA